MFDSILPANARPANPELPANLLALLPGNLPITSGMARNIGPGAGQAYQPTQRPLPSSVPGASNGPAPIEDALASIRTLRLPPRPDLPLPNATQAGLQAGGAAAAGAKVYDSPLATLTSSVLAGLQAGIPAFRAQRQANKEAEYMAAIAAHDAKQYRTYIDSAEAAKTFGDHVGVARAMNDRDLRDFLVKNSVVQPVTYSQNAQGQVIQSAGVGAKGQVVQGATLDQVAPGRKVPRTQLVDGRVEAVKDATGAIVYDDPNPLPQANPAALSAAAREDRDIRALAGMEPNEPITEDNRDAFLHATTVYRAMNRAPARQSTPSARIVSTDKGLVSIDPLTKKVTPLTDASGAPLQKEKTAAMVKAQTDSAVVAKVLGSTDAGGDKNADQTAQRTATAKAILAGKHPGDKALAQAWLKLHPGNE